MTTTTQTEETISSRATAESVLQAIVGRPDAHLREDQWVAIHALVHEHRRALVVQRTGWGKSAVYFVATALLRARGAGPTVIISPLLALMRNQVDAASRAGIRAITLNSTNTDDWSSLAEQITADHVDVLLVSPERLNNPAFRDDVLPSLARNAGMLVIDEAHCISDWGHDFRPDYRRIQHILTQLNPDIPVLATTATANHRVTQDIAEQLRSGGPEPLVMRGELARTSLRLGVMRTPDETERLAWIVAALHRVPGSGIIYVQTIAHTFEVSDHLRQAGFDALPYSGKTDATEREVAEAALQNNQVKALVATSALGMGYDKPDVSFVFHLGAPSSPISYYQQVGRAGRGLDEAWGILLPTPADTAIWDYFDNASFPKESDVAQVLAALPQDSPTSVPKLEKYVDLKRSKLEMLLKILDVDGAARRVQGGWLATGQAWTYDADRYVRVAESRAHERQQMLDYGHLNTCRMKFLRVALEDATLAEETELECGHCDVCIGQPAIGGISADVIASIRGEQESAGPQGPKTTTILPRKQWPVLPQGLTLSNGFVINKTTLAPAIRHEEGIALTRFDALGLGGVARELFAPEAPDQEVPVPLRFALRDALQDWQGKIDGVVFVGSFNRPRLVQHLAHGAAKILAVPVVAEVESHGEPSRHDVNSVQRLRGVAPRLRLGHDNNPLDDYGHNKDGHDKDLQSHTGHSLSGLRIALIDDYCDSRWTLTTATVLLRQAGAAQVSPIVLAQF